MEHVNTTNIRQQQQHQQLQQHQLEQQQQHNENQQQFCLRWHNHQTSLLSTLPVLLDQSHLTDVTISAEGRQLRAHRVVLSACSSFFMDIFRALEASNHPVIIIPGASFGAIVALLTFMYSGEVNVYEEQIPMLLNLAETLGIKGLADVQNNNQLPKPANTGAASTVPSSPYAPEKHTKFERPSTPPTPTPTPTATPTPTPALPQLPQPSLSAQTPLLANKLSGCTPLENFFLKSLQFYPSLLPQPLNFSQTALNKTSELLAKYQQQCQLYQGGLEEHEDGYGAKRPRQMSTIVNPTQLSQQLHQQQQQQQKDIKRIDKIVDNLRVGNVAKSPMECGGGSATSPVTLTPPALPSHYSPQHSVKSSPSYAAAAAMGSQLLYSKPSSYNAHTPTTAQQAHQHNVNSYITPEDQAKLQQHIEQYAAAAAANASTSSSSGSGMSGISGISMSGAKSEPNLLALTEKLPTLVGGVAANKPPSNSKLYATCFICHKQLSNQYNLRVHLETHQNVRYACNVCSHVSRSKDALRKHVSYRHPGAPSPCENEARRKRVNKLTSPSAATAAAATPTHTATSVDAAAAAAAAVSASSSFIAGNSSDGLSPALGSNPYLFLPNQFQLAAAAAAVAVAESHPTPTLDLAHEPVSIKSETPPASNGEVGETGAAAT